MNAIRTMLFSVLAFCVVSFANAATFSAAPGSVINASVGGDGCTVVVSWTGVGNISYVVQYRHDTSDGKAFRLRHTPSADHSVTFNACEGDRFQFVNADGKFLFLSRELAVSRHSPLRMNGAGLECGDRGGCALQVE